MAPNMGILATLSAFNGLGVAAIMATHPTAVSKLFGVENLNLVVGIQYFVSSFGLLLGPSLDGYILELSNHNYVLAMFIAGGVYLSGFFLAIISFFTYRFSPNVGCLQSQQGTN